MFYVRPIITSKKIPLEGIQKKIRKESNHVKKKNQQNRKEDKRKRQKKLHNR